MGTVGDRHTRKGERTRQKTMVPKRAVSPGGGGYTGGGGGQARGGGVVPRTCSLSLAPSTAREGCCSPTKGYKASMWWGRRRQCSGGGGRLSRVQALVRRPVGGPSSIRFHRGAPLNDSIRNHRLSGPCLSLHLSLSSSIKMVQRKEVRAFLSTKTLLRAFLLL